jgi:short-subunit dehydrogenase
VVLPFDLGSCSGHAKLVAAAASELGGIDVLINNAGVQRFTLFEKDDPAEIAALVAVNLTSPLLLTHAALAHFRASGAGHVVNVGSTFGAIGFPHFAAYSASKFALRGFSEALRRELLDSKIRVTYVSPRATATDMNGPDVCEMQKRTGTRVDLPRIVAQAIISALADDAAAMQLGWPERFFVRLNALWPSLVDRALARQNRVGEIRT